MFPISSMPLVPPHFSGRNRSQLPQRSVPEWYIRSPLGQYKKRAALRRRYSGEGLQRMLRHHIRTAASEFITKLRYIPMPTNRQDRLIGLIPRYRELLKDDSILKEKAGDDNVTFVFTSVSQGGRVALDRKRGTSKVLPESYRVSLTPIGEEHAKARISWERKDKKLATLHVESSLIPKKGHISRADYQKLKKTITDSLRYVAGWFDDKAVI